VNKKLIAVFAVCSIGISVHGGAGATNLFDPSVSATTVLDGSSVELNGTLNDTNGNSQPWTAELYAGQGECLRLFVTSTAFDGKLTVTAPNGQVFRDDDGGGFLRPLVKIASAPNRGWYTVQMAEWTGAPTNANFTLLYGRYTAGNPNCAGGTVPVSGALPEAYKDTSVQVPATPKNNDAP
jgi:hypothetical protein